MAEAAPPQPKKDINSMTKDDMVNEILFAFNINPDGTLNVTRAPEGMLPVQINKTFIDSLDAADLKLIVTMIRTTDVAGLLGTLKTRDEAVISSAFELLGHMS